MSEYATGITANFTTATEISNGYVYVVNPVSLYDYEGYDEMGNPKNIIKEDKDMMGLYEVYVVDTKKGKLLIHNDIVAKNEDKAKLRVAMGHGTDIPDDVEFFVHCIGTWESRKPKEVKIVKE